ncbi:hypothetical protein [Micromonospora sp. NPDC049240]|uniref:hypothetical protein n=1 Tax=Micromonospora sp. NPDC049240 TaxID=3155151 RepID=UPI0033DF16D3
MITIAQARVAKSSMADVFILRPGEYQGDAVTVIDFYLKGSDLWVEVKRIEATGHYPASDLEAGREIKGLMESGAYDAAGYAKGEKSPEQTRIYEAAEDLTELLRQVVPDSTIHYAVEEARRALRVLSKKADTILTNDRLPVRELQS